MTEAPRRRSDRLLQMALRTWPRRLRERHGAAALEAARTALEEGSGGAWGVAAETAALARAGLGLRAAGWHRGLLNALGEWARDVGSAGRTLARAPGFTATAVVSLSLGIGMTAAIFATVDDALLRPPPYHEPDDLVVVWNTRAGTTDRFAVAGPDAGVLQERATLLDPVAFSIRGVDASLAVGDGSRAEHVRLAAVTPQFFPTLGVTAALGSTFSDYGPGLVLSHDAWVRLLGGDPDVIGTTVRVNGVGVEVRGVMPATFRLVLAPTAGVDAAVDAWIALDVPLADFHRAERLLDQDSDNSGFVVARLAPGATAAAADAEARRIAADLRATVPGYADAGLDFSVRPLHADATRDARPVLIALMAGGALVLLGTCLNLTTLQLARGVERAGEMAVRTALGASRLRLARQLVTESLTLVAAGTAGALAVGSLASDLLRRAAPWHNTYPTATGLDGRALGWTLAAAAIAAVVSGLVPMLHAAGALPLHRAPRRSRARTALVVAEVAVTVVLVLGAGLVLRTTQALARMQPGFEPLGALTFDVSLRGVAREYRGPAARAEVMRAIHAGVAALPGVRSAGYVGVLPLGGDRWTQPYGLPGQAEAEWEANRADFRVASSGLFAALGARVVDGRPFTPDEDVREDERVVVVDQALADRIAPGGSAVGASIGVPVDGQALQARVVGVVEPIRYERLDQDGREAVYVPYRQEALLDVSFVVRADGDLDALAAGVRDAVRAVDAGIPVYRVRPLQDYVAQAMAPQRFAWALLGVFAALALVSAALGLYGVVAYEVGRRTPELGIRMAVGARRADVVRGVVWGGVRLGAVGVAAGALVSVLTLGVLDSVLVGVGRADPLTWTASLAAVFSVTLAACVGPARRASRLDPSAALRAE